MRVQHTKWLLCAFGVGVMWACASIPLRAQETPNVEEIKESSCAPCHSVTRTSPTAQPWDSISVYGDMPQEMFREPGKDIQASSGQGELCVA